MPLVENVAKILNLLEHRGSCANLQILLLSSSATVSTGFTDLFDQINRLGIPVFV